MIFSSSRARSTDLNELRQKLNELYHLGQEHGSASSWCMPGLMDQKDKEADRLINEIMAAVKGDCGKLRS